MVEGAGLENQNRRKSIGGSNPFLTANFVLKASYEVVVHISVGEVTERPKVLDC